MNFAKINLMICFAILGTILFTGCGGGSGSSSTSNFISSTPIGVDGYVIKLESNATAYCSDTNKKYSTDILDSNFKIKFKDLPIGDKCIVTIPADAWIDADNSGDLNKSVDKQIGFAMKGTSDEKYITLLTTLTFSIPDGLNKTKMLKLVKNFNPVAGAKKAQTNEQAKKLLILSEIIKRALLEGKNIKTFDVSDILNTNKNATNLNLNKILNGVTLSVEAQNKISSTKALMEQLECIGKNNLNADDVYVKFSDGDKSIMQLVGQNVLDKCVAKTTPTYSWDIQEWGVCEGSCGTNNATQTRVVQCKDLNDNIVNDTLCTQTKPTTEQACTVSLCNVAPIADAGIDQTVTEGDAVTLSASNSSDSDGTITTYLWKEGTTTLSTSSSFNKSNFNVGTHTITLSITDDDGASDTDTVIVNVNKLITHTTIGVQQIVPTSLSQTALISSVQGDGDLCTLESPCSIRTAISKINTQGGVLFLRGGTYNLLNSLDINKEGTADNPVIIESYPGERAILKGPFVSISYLQDHLNERNRGVNIRGSYIKFRSIDVVNMGYEGIVISGSHDTIEGCRIHDNRLSGIVLYGGEWHENNEGYVIPYVKGYNTIRDNFIYFNSDEGTVANGGNSDGISISSGRFNRITHNTVHDNSDDGIDAWRSNYSYIAYNYSYNNGKASGDGNGFKAGGNCKRDNNGNCIRPNFEAGNGIRALVQHNIAYGNRADGFDVNSGIDVVFSYNTAYHNGRNGFVGSHAGRTVIHHNIASSNENPMYSIWGEPENYENSWNMNDEVTFKSLDPNNPAFLVPASDAFTQIGAYANAKVDISQKIYGVTIDTIKQLDKTIEALITLPKRTVVRVIFDKVPASDYDKAIDRLVPYTDIMGELFNSKYIKYYSMNEYKNRVNEYLDDFGDKVAIWEIGNEVNGEWAYNHDSETPNIVAEKTIYAYTEAKRRGYKTALTLNYNDYDKDNGCYNIPTEKMRDWAREMLPESVRNGIDYLLVSYREEDCNGHKPTVTELNGVFDDLGALFPNAKLGFGEIGATRGDKSGYLSRYCTLPISHERFIGGYFWRYFVQDMVPSYKPMHNTLSDIMQGTVKKYPKDTTLSNGDLVHAGYDLDESIPRPGYKASTHEGGLFDTSITQVTNATGDDAISPVHHYSKDSVWNANSSLMLLQAGKKLVDAKTYDLIHTFNTSSKKLLSHLNKDFRYGIGWVSSHHYGIVKENLLTKEETLLYEIPGFYDRITIGEYEGNMDYNDTYMLLTAHIDGNNDDIPTFILYNFKTNSSVIKNFDGTNGTQALHLTSDRVQNRLNWATVSPLGRYILVYHYDTLKDGKDGSHSTDWHKKIEKYDLNLNFIETMAYKGNHGDVCVSQDIDKEYYVQFENDGIGADGMYENSGQKGIWEYNLMTKERDMIVQNHGGGHVSCRNYQRPGWAYITYKSSQPNDRDIFAIMLGKDGTDIHGNRIVNRFAKARFMAIQNSGYNYSDRSAHSTPNPDGTKVIFKSNWKDGEPLDDFVAEKLN